MSFLKIILNDSITNTPKKLCQKVTGHKIYSGDYNSQYGSYTPDEHSNRRYVKGDQRKNLQTMLDLQDKYGGDIYKNDKDESFYLKNKNGTFFNNGRALNAKTGKMTNYNMSTGRFIVPTKTNVTVQNNTGSTSQPTRPAQARRSIQSAKPMQTVRPKGITHTATYTPGQDAKGAYAVKGWTTNQWGGGKRGILDADVAKKLGLKEGATAQDAQNFLKSKGYGITSDNYWGKQSQAAFNDFINRGSVKAATVETPQLDTKTERHNYATWDPKTKQYDNYNPNFEITPQQLRDAGVTNFRTYQNFMGNPANASNQYKGVYDFFNRVKEQNSGTNFGDETAFNKFFGTSGNFGRRDRNRIISVGATSQAVYDRVSPQGTPITTRSEYGSQYDALNKTLTDDDRKVGNIVWVNSGDTKIPIYQAANGNYYKLGDNNTLIQTGTYTMDPDGKYSVTFRNGGILNKFQQGGQINMNEQQLQQAFLQYLMQKTGAQDEQQLEQVVQQLGEDGLEQAYAQFIQEMQQQQVQAAKFGAKLNYIKKLNGQCPDGYELQYYKSGGQLCKKCMKKQVMQDGEYLPQDPIDQFKCGRKIKKKKCEAGGTVNLDKCGAKMKKKKCEDGGIVNIDKCGAKIKKKKCENGGFIPFDKCGKKIKKNQKGGSFNTAWNKARTAGNRYFWFNGRTYNTKKKGESDAYWAKHFKDNATSGGANNIQTDVGLSGGWKGVKGANIGRYNTKGQWIRSKQSIKNVPKNAVYGARGDSVRQSDYKIFAPIDKPKTAQTIGYGSNKGTKTTNGIITVGNKIPEGRPLTFGGIPYKVEQSTSVPNLIFQGGFNSANPGNYWVNPLTPGFETKR